MSEKLYIGKLTVAEVPITHTDEFPNEIPKFGEPSRAPFKKLFEFPITALVHNTHTEEKEGICEKRDGKARFKANEKLSRPTIKMNSRKNGWRETPIEKDEPLIPGKYVWFSMKPTLPEDSEFNKENYNVPYVNGTTFYGPWSFTFDYSWLISSYREHIKKHSDPSKRDATVVLRNGGTLTYKKEICYVVIVTHSKDMLHLDHEYPIIDDVLTTPNIIFHPRCIPPPFLNNDDQNWTDYPDWLGYKWKELGHYDHVAFAINCDWEGEITEVKLWDYEEVAPANGGVGEEPPIFKIKLPPGEPHNYFEDCEDDSKEAYSEYHPICLKCGNVEKNGNIGFPSCYSDEYSQWLDEMPNKIDEMAKKVKQIGTKMETVIKESRDDATEMSVEIVQMAKKATEIFEKACKMAVNIIPTEVKKETERIILNMTKGTEKAIMARRIAKVAESIAEQTECTEDDQQAQVMKKIAQQKMKVAQQNIKEIDIPGKVAYKIEEIAMRAKKRKNTEMDSAEKKKHKNEMARHDDSSCQQQ